MSVGVIQSLLIWAFIGLALWDWIMIMIEADRRKITRGDYVLMVSCMFLGPIGIILRVLSYTDRTGRPWRHVFGRHRRCLPNACKKSAWGVPMHYEDPSGESAPWDDYYTEKYGA